MRGRIVFGTVLGCILLTLASPLLAQKMPAAEAGKIPTPTGKIAFIRDKDLWVMDVNGQGQMRVVDANNVDGRVSWAPDGRRIAFSRSGLASLDGPDPMSGGKHKVYDLFIAFLDSAEVGNTFWWNRITDDLGSRDPEWSKDGQTIIFCKDMSANRVNGLEPNYQVCTISPDATDLQVLRKDWANMGEFLMNPSMSPTGDIAFVHLAQLKAQGIIVRPRSNFMIPQADMKAASAKLKDCVAPAWSPDGKWLAYVKNDLAKPGLFITSPDLTKKYLIYEPPAGNALQTGAPGWSPDSKWLTFATTDGSIWICDITGNQLKRVSTGLDSRPAWSKGPVR